MLGWCDANPKKLKTKDGVKKFINSWLSKEQDKGGSLTKEEREVKLETQKAYIKEVNRKLENDNRSGVTYLDTE